MLDDRSPELCVCQECPATQKVASITWSALTSDGNRCPGVRCELVDVRRAGKRDRRAVLEQHLRPLPRTEAEPSVESGRECCSPEAGEEGSTSHLSSRP